MAFGSHFLPPGNEILRQGRENHFFHPTQEILILEYDTGKCLSVQLSVFTSQRPSHKGFNLRKQAGSVAVVLVKLFHGSISIIAGDAQGLENAPHAGFPAAYASGEQDSMDRFIHFSAEVSSTTTSTSPFTLSTDSTTHSSFGQNGRMSLGSRK